jgi:N-acetylglucosamine-6-phosphate deacetylase
VTTDLLLAGGRVVTPRGVLDRASVLVRDGVIRAVLPAGDTGLVAAGQVPAGQDAARGASASGVPVTDAGSDVGMPVTDAGSDVGMPVTDAGSDAGMPVTATELAAAERIDLAGRYLLPGFVDLHVHGGAGVSFDDGTEAIAAAVAAHRTRGTTRTMLSLITASPVDMTASIRAAAVAAASDRSVLGIHLEGPFLAENRRGAHDPAKLLDPDPAVLEEFLVAGDGRIRVVTLAPERPGGLDLVRRLVSAGVHAAVGHSDAGYDAAAAAFDAGADLVTHAFNGMRPLHHRDPGIVAAAMDAGAVLEAINDGVHLHDATVRLLHAIAPGRLVLVTDAMAAACAADGAYRLGSMDVTVTDGVARLTGQDAIAGSTLTMDVALRRAVHDVGLDLVLAANAASLVPARLLGVDDRFGSITPGRAADLVVAGDDLAVHAVLADGHWVDDRRP